VPEQPSEPNGDTREGSATSPQGYRSWTSLAATVGERQIGTWSPSREVCCVEGVREQYRASVGADYHDIHDRTRINNTAALASRFDAQL